MQSHQVFMVQQHVRGQLIEPSAVQPLLQLFHDARCFKGIGGIGSVDPVAEAADAPADSLGFLFLPKDIDRPVQGGLHRPAVQSLRVDLFACFPQQR